MRIQILSIVWIKPEEVMKINEHVKLSNQMLSIDWIILFIWFLFSKYTLSIDLIMMILNKRIEPEKVMKINEHYLTDSSLMRKIQRHNHDK